jgi:hypothetical protein
MVMQSTGKGTLYVTGSLDEPGRKVYTSDGFSSPLNIAGDTVAASPSGCGLNIADTRSRRYAQVNDSCVSNVVGDSLLIRPTNTEKERHPKGAVTIIPRADVASMRPAQPPSMVS